jgi:group I intron endonuclease
MRIGIVYKITNKKTGNCYIGVTSKTLSYRKAKHINESKNRCKTKFHKALRSYGESGFIFEELCSVLYSYENLCFLENYFIRLYDSINSGYNLIYSDFSEDVSIHKSNSTRSTWQNKRDFMLSRQAEGRRRMTPEDKEKAKNNLMSALNTPERKMQMSEQAKLKWSSGKIDKEKHAERLQKRWSRPGEKERASESGKLSNKDRERPIIAVNVYSGDVISFASVHDAMRSGFSASCITQSLKLRVKTGQDHVWFYKTTEDTDFYKNEALKRLDHPFKTEFTKPILGVNIETGDVVKFNTTLEVNSQGFKPKEVIRVLRGHRKSAHGYYWKFA